MPDLSKLLSATATPMPDAAETQLALPSSAAEMPTMGPPQAAAGAKPRSNSPLGRQDETATANLENLNFKVPKSFRKRFRDCAYRADLRHNELLFEALDAWEGLHKSKN